MAILRTTFMKIEKSKLNYTYSINHITTNQNEYPQRCFRKIISQEKNMFQTCVPNQKVQRKETFFRLFLIAIIRISKI
jgi:hypothetical protein